MSATIRPMMRSIARVLPKKEMCEDMSARCIKPVKPVKLVKKVKSDKPVKKVNGDRLLAFASFGERSRSVGKFAVQSQEY